MREAKGVQDPSTCVHDRNAAVILPARGSGKMSNAHPFIWCRECGSLWLPSHPALNQAFERHVRNATGPIQGASVEGFWILPGELSIVVS